MKSPGARNPVVCLHSVIAVALLGLSRTAPAVERVWDGGGSVNTWSSASNWTGFRIDPPDPGDDLTFPAGAAQMTNVNNFAAGTAFGTITWSGAGYNASGNQVALTGGLHATHGSGTTVIHFPIALDATQTFSVPQAGSTMFLNGTISLGFRALTIDGAGQTVVAGNVSSTLTAGRIVKQGAGTLWFLGSPTFSGTTTINGGTVRVDGALQNSRVIVNSGGALRGAGTVAGITANAGGAVSPGFNTTDALNSDGDLILNAGSTLNIRLNGTTAETNYDQIDVTGIVTLGGTLNITTGFLPPVGSTFTIIDNDGSDNISGTFAGLPEGAEFTINGRPFRISYGARFGGVFGRDNDVTIEAVPALCIWDGGGGINRLWTTPHNWVDDILPITGDDIQFAEDSLSGTPDNDFPAGSRFGSIIFAGGSVTLNGNGLQFDGPIRDTGAAGSASIRFPLTLAAGINAPATSLGLSEDVLLVANQTFSGGSITVSGDLDLGPHRLTLNAGVGTTTRLEGLVNGAGGITKEGPGSLQTIDILCGEPVIINGGRFSVRNPEPGEPASVSGLIQINAGGFLDVYQPFGEQRTHFGALEIRGGRLKIGEPTFVSGHLSLLDGASFEYMWGGVTIGSNKLVAGGPVTIDGCSFTFIPDDIIHTGQVMTAIATSGPATPVGTFDGLGEGSQFMLGSRRMGITYSGGDGNDIQIIADPPPIPWSWDGGGAGAQWMTAGNWNPDSVPLQYSALLFPDGVSERIMDNNFPAGTAFYSLTFQRDSYIVGGNTLAVAKGIYNEFASGPTVIAVPLILTGEDDEDTVVGVSNASELRISSAVTGRMAKTGAGTLALSGNTANALSGEIPAGTVTLHKSGANALIGPLTVGNGSGLSELLLMADHQIADDASLTIAAPSRLNVNGHMERIDSLNGDGSVMLGSLGAGPGGLTVSDGVFSGAISGLGSLTKSGDGSLTLGGSPSFAGNTLIDGGTFLLPGSLQCAGLTIAGNGNMLVNGTLSTAGPLQLQSGLLRGKGTVPAINATGGTIHPGVTAAAAFQVKLRCGSLTMGPAAAFRATLTGVDPDYENPRLNVTGSVSLDGALQLDRIYGPLPAAGLAFVLIENDGGESIGGNFAGLSHGAIFDEIGMRWQISYTAGDGNDVAITFVELVPPVVTGFSIQPGTGPNAGKDVAVIDAEGIPQVNHLLHYSPDLVNWIYATGAVSTDSDLRFQFPMPQGTKRSFFRVQRQ
jgi:autotransporter-associated beta strand protein